MPTIYRKVIKLESHATKLLFLMLNPAIPLKHTPYNLKKANGVWLINLELLWQN